MLTDPGNGRNTRAVEADVEDDANEYQCARPSHSVRLHLEGLQVDRDELERDSGDRKRNRHAEQTNDHQNASSELVNQGKIDYREDEVGCRDRDGDSSGVGETDDGEKLCRVVHERVEAAQLRDSHGDTGYGDSSCGGGCSEDAAEGAP